MTTSAHSATSASLRRLTCAPRCPGGSITPHAGLLKGIAIRLANENPVHMTTRGAERPDAASERFGRRGPDQFGDVGDANQQYLVTGAKEQRLGYHAADREALGVAPFDDCVAGGAQCGDTSTWRGRGMPDQ